MVFLLLALHIYGLSPIISMLNVVSLHIFIAEFIIAYRMRIRIGRRVKYIKIKGFLINTTSLYFLLILLNKLIVKYYTSKNK